MTNSADPGQLVSSKKPTDLDPHCLQMPGISGFSRTRVNTYHAMGKFSRQQIDIFLIFFSKKIGSDTCMKCQILFSRKNKKTFQNVVC